MLRSKSAITLSAIFLLIILYSPARGYDQNLFKQVIFLEEIVSYSGTFLVYEQGFSQESLVKSMAIDNSYSDKIDYGPAHKALGYSTLLLMTLTGVTGGDSSFHINLGRLTGLGVIGTCVTGYIEYGDVWDNDEIFSSTNLHIGLGTIGTLGMIAALAIAESENSGNDTGKSHAGLGVASAGAMAVSFIKIKW